MEFRLLGPVEVYHAEQCVQIGGFRQRAAVAALALNVGRTLTPNSLIRMVWAQNPPATVRQQLFNCVSRLRRVLGGAIVTRPQGYALDVDPTRVDASRFDAMVVQARQAAEDGPLDDAVDRMRAALALWQGPALDGLPGLAADAVRLEERRLVALEDRLDWELALGRHVEAVPELYALSTTHPLRERLTAQLMLGLYRCGRAADALEVCRLAKQRFVAELGLDPGEQLRRLESAILRGDAGLDVARRVPIRVGPERDTRADPGERPPGVPVPRQLPSGAHAFTGRADALDALDALLPADGRDQDGAVTVATVSGAAGVGKTALAVHWAHRVSQRFPDGQLYAELRSCSAPRPMRPVAVLAQFLRALGVPAERVPLDQDEAAGMYRTLVAGRQMLVVLDNAHSSDQVRPLIPGSPACRVVVTSRNPLGDLVIRDGARRLCLDALSPAEAHTLLGRIIGADRTRVEPGATAELADLCGLLPLTLRVAATHLAAQPRRRIADYVRELRRGNRRIGPWVGGDGLTAGGTGTGGGASTAA